MDKELTFYPESERTRDLVYTEYSSCNQSIHLLLQESPGVQYEFLLKAYREIISSYLSFETLNLPIEFLKTLVLRFDQMCEEWGLSVDDCKGMGIHVLLRAANAVYVMTSRESDILLCREGELMSLEVTGDGRVERVRVDDSDGQEELFPQALSDVFTIVRLDPKYVRDMDLALGCREEEKGTVLEALGGPMWLEAGPAEEKSGERRIVVSKFVSRKIIVVRFKALGYLDGAGADKLPVGVRRSRPRIPIRRRFVVAGAAAVAAVLIGVLWTGEMSGPEKLSGDENILTENRIDRNVVDAETGTATNEMAQEKVFTLTAGWEKTYDDQVTSSPARFDRWVVFGCRDGNVYAVEREVGTLVWKFKATAGVGTSPAIQGENVLIADYNGNVFAISGRNGTQVWQRKLPMRVVSSPIVAGNHLLVGCYDGYAYCLSGEDGSVVWKRKTRGRVRATAATDGNSFFVPSYDGYLYALDAGSGSILWRSNIGGQLTGAPATVGGRVVVGAPDGRVHCLDAASGNVNWTYTAGSAVKAGIAISSGKVFAGSNDTHVHCLNLADGTLNWKYKTGDIVLSRPYIKGGTVYVGSYDGFMYALDTGSGALRDRYDTGGAIFSSPIADDENLYFGTNRGNFVCLRHNAEKTS